MSMRAKDQKINHRRTVKFILNIWTIITMLMFVLDFISGNRYDISASAVGIIYIGILGIYVSDKEYSRWNNSFVSRFLGEGFVITWTILMIMFVVTAPLSEGSFRIPEEFALVYTSVIAAFAITLHSKALKSSKS